MGTRLALVTGTLAVWLVGTSALANTSDKGPTYRRNRGRIVFAAKALAEPATEKEFNQMVRLARRTKTLSLGEGRKWSFHFIAFLRRAPRANKVNLVWYKLGKKREQVDFVEFVVLPDGHTLRANATLSQAQFKVGDKLEARITRLIGGREKVYAKCRFTLQK